MPESDAYDKHFEKIDDTIEHLRESGFKTSQTAAVHEEKLNRIKTEILTLIDDFRNMTIKLSNLQKEISDDIDDIEKMIEKNKTNSSIESNSKIETLSTSNKEALAKLESRIEKLENYKFIIVGAIVVVSYISEHINLFSSLLTK